MTECSFGLSLSDDISNDAEILAQVGRRKALHEFRRLPQLDLKDDGEVAIAAHSLEMQSCNLAKAFNRATFGGHALASGGNRLGHRPLEDRNQQVVLALEIEIDGAGGDAGGTGDVGDLRIEEAAGGEGFGRGAEQRVALVGFV